MIGIAKRKHAFLGPRLLLVAPAAAEGGVEAVGVEGVDEGMRVHRRCVDAARIVERIHAGRERLLVHVYDQLEAVLGAIAVAKLDHLPEVPGRVDVQEREGHRPGRERLAGHVQHAHRVFADRIEQHRIFEGGGDLADRVDRLGFEGVEIAERVGHGTERTAGG